MCQVLPLLSSEIIIVFYVIMGPDDSNLNNKNTFLNALLLYVNVKIAIVYKLYKAVV